MIGWHLLYFYFYAAGPQVLSRISITTLGSGPTLTCEANFGADLNLATYWYILSDNGTKMLCRPPQFSVKRPQYNHETCTWTSQLRITANFERSTKTIIFCGRDSLWANFTVNSEGNYVNHG